MQRGVSVALPHLSVSHPAAAKRLSSSPLIVALLYLAFFLFTWSCVICLRLFASVCETVGCVKVKKKKPKTTHRDLHFTPSF